MNAASADERLAALHAMYDRDLGPFLAGQDAELRRARRLRWPVLFGGLIISFGLFAYALRTDTFVDALIWIASAFALGAILLFFAITGSIADDIRHRLLQAICDCYGLAYAPDAAGFSLEPFAILDLAGYNHIRLVDRVSGHASGRDCDLAAGKIGDETTEIVIGGDDKKKLNIRLDGLLMRFGDPRPPQVPFRLIPRADKSSAGTGDPEFDRIFAIEADDPAAARRDLDAPTRGALVAIAGIVGGTTPMIGFAGGSILLAFPTQRRFEIGKLKPPLADFARTEHLAAQVAIVFDVAGLLAARAGGGIAGAIGVSGGLI